VPKACIDDVIAQLETIIADHIYEPAVDRAPVVSILKTELVAAWVEIWRLKQAAAGRDPL
jgi:hypothetical protein